MSGKASGRSQMCVTVPSGPLFLGETSSTEEFQD